MKIESEEYLFEKWKQKLVVFLIQNKSFVDENERRISIKF